MAKPKLTKEAIKYIVSLYNSETENHTFSEIKDKIKDKYAIEVSLQAVQQNYHKYMEDLNKAKKVESLRNVQKENSDVKEKSDDVRPVPKSSTSNIFGAFNTKKQTVTNNDVQYQNLDELGVADIDIENLLKVDN